MIIYLSGTLPLHLTHSLSSKSASEYPHPHVNLGANATVTTTREMTSSAVLGHCLVLTNNRLILATLGIVRTADLVEYQERRHRHIDLSKLLLERKGQRGMDRQIVLI